MLAGGISAPKPTRYRSLGMGKALFVRVFSL
jgi:hypothetical protein